MLEKEGSLGSASPTVAAAVIIVRLCPGGASQAAPWKESAYSTGDAGSISGSGRSPGGGNGNPLWYACLENSTDKGAWQATVHGGHKESDTTERTRTHVRIQPTVGWGVLSQPPPSAILKAV